MVHNRLSGNAEAEVAGYMSVTEPLTALDWQEVFLVGARVAYQAVERREDPYTVPRALEAMAAKAREIAERQNA